MFKNAIYAAGFIDLMTDPRLVLMRKDAIKKSEKR